jgi:hypothetical protein
MLKPINVFDDLIPAKLADYFETIIFGTSDSVELDPLINFKIKREPTAKEDGYAPVSFKHILKSNAEQSPYLNIFSSIPQLVCEKNNIFLKDILYARIFLTVPYNTEKRHMQPHTDLAMDHAVVLYYVNDADGDTVFFDNENNIIESVSPKKGRVVLFNGAILHGGGIPTLGERCIVNYDILV